jgi:hypothetical protein
MRLLKDEGGCPHFAHPGGEALATCDDPGSGTGLIPAARDFDVVPKPRLVHPTVERVETP